MSLLIHNVFFRLRDRSPNAVAALTAACRKYLTVQPGIAYFAAGPVAADLTRDVNVTDWDVGLTVVFVDRHSHDLYQDDATHNQFIAENKANWDSVRVFDSLAERPF